MIQWFINNFKLKSIFKTDRYSLAATGIWTKHNFITPFISPNIQRILDCISFQFRYISTACGWYFLFYYGNVFMVIKHRYVTQFDTYFIYLLFLEKWMKAVYHYMALYSFFVFQLMKHKNKFPYCRLWGTQSTILHIGV